MWLGAELEKLKDLKLSVTQGAWSALLTDSCHSRGQLHTNLNMEMGDFIGRN